ncbi:MAG: hypothetical protein HKO02_02660 [Hyphomonadaceae bacterium]|nr:hypothetical protein [Hyphomonadaceae bacterium]
MRLFLTVFLIMLWALPANGQDLPKVVSDGADATALTIYPDNLALITERRTIDLPAGKSTIVFDGVNDRMIASSAMLRAFSGFSIERNFDYALLNKANLFDRSVGEYVTLTRTHKKTGKVTRDRAKIVSVGEGVVFDIDGKIETFQCSGLSEGTWFENLPEGLTNKPKLSIDVDAEEAGPQDVVISYLADRFSWKSDYRLDLNKDEVSGGLNGWLTINNQTSQSFMKAPTAVIAGKLNRNYQTKAQDFPSKSIYANCWPRQSTQTPIPVNPSLYMERSNSNLGFMSAPPRVEMESLEMSDLDQVVVTGSRMAKQEATQEEFGDYKLYRTAEPVTVAAYQTKQVIFINEPDVEVEKVYSLDFQLGWLQPRAERPNVTPAIIEYRLDNSRDGKLAKPLPKGVMRVLTRNENRKLLVIGETDVVDTAIDNPMKIYLDESHLVQIQTSVLDHKNYKTSKGRRYEFKMEQTINNATEVPAKVEINLIGTYNSFRLENENVGMDSDVGPRSWAITVAPNTSFDLTYTAIYDS